MVKQPKVESECWLLLNPKELLRTGDEMLERKDGEYSWHPMPPGCDVVDTSVIVRRKLDDRLGEKKCQNCEKQEAFAQNMAAQIKRFGMEGE